MRRRIARLAALVAGDTARFAPPRLAAALLTVVGSPLLARLLGPAGYGSLAVAVTVVLVGSALLLGWLEVAAVRELADGSRPAQETVADVLVPVVGATALAAAAASAAYAVGGDGLLVALVAAAGITWGLTAFFNGALRARSDAWGFAGLWTMASGGRFLLGIPAALAGLGVRGVIAGWVVSMWGGLAVGLRRLRVRLGRLRLRRPPREVTRFASPVVLVTFGMVALSLADRLILSLYVSDAAVGVYALAYAIVEQSLVLLFSILLATKFPELLRVFDAEGPERAAHALGRALEGCLAIAVAVGLPLALFGGEILRLVGGDAYARGDTSFIPLVVAGVVLMGLAQYAAIPFQQARRTRPWAVAVGLAVVVNVGLNFLLVPRLGLLGAGIATAAGYAALAASSFALASRHIPRYLGAARVWAPAGAAAAALALWSATRASVPVGVEAPTVVLAYATALAAVFFIRQRRAHALLDGHR